MVKSFKNFLIEMAPPGTKEIVCDIDGICKTILQDESGGNEKKVLSVYKDSKGLPTIGHGHLITKDSPKIFGEVFAQEQKTDPNFVSTILSGKGRLTSNQAERLLKRDVQTRLPQLVKLVPNFETYSSELQANLASEQFRGMLGKSPKALKALNSGDFSGFATNYIDAEDYRKSKEENTGIYKRMDRLANSAKTEEVRQKKSRQSLSATTQAPQNSSTQQNGTSR